jgi:serine phosphatase RsbU (regulator of sigma subunit)
MFDEYDTMRTLADTLPDAGQPEETGHVTLLVHFHGGMRVVPLTVAEAVVVGRSSPADLVLPEARLSREHARFSIVDGVVWVEDLGSTNGTSVNGKRVKRHALGAADRVILAGVSIFVHTDHLPASDDRTSDLHREAEAARVIQERLVGPSEVVERGPVQLAGFYRPASICGGDFWNFFDMGPGRTLVAIGDVTGHGMSAAMLTAAAKACCDTLLSTHGPQVSLETVMQTLNEVIRRVGRSQQVMTLMASLIDAGARKLIYANAGHPAPFHCRREGSRYHLRALSAVGYRLGDHPRPRFRTHEVELLSDDVLVWYTDGLVPGSDSMGLFRGEKRIRETLVAHAHLPPGELRDHLVQAALGDRGDAPLEDDVTLVVGKLRF